MIIEMDNYHMVVVRIPPELLGHNAQLRWWLMDMFEILVAILIFIVLVIMLKKGLYVKNINLKIKILGLDLNIKTDEKRDPSDSKE